MPRRLEAVQAELLVVFKPQISVTPEYACSDTMQRTNTATPQMKQRLQRPSYRPKVTMTQTLSARGRQPDLHLLWFCGESLTTETAAMRPHDAHV